MRTEKHSVGASDVRFAALARMGEVVFRAKDAANLWGMTNQNTLHTTLSRYAKAGLLWRLQNGLYALKNSREISPHIIGGKALHRYCYVSMETVLARAGLIQQRVPSTTFVSSVSKRFSLAGYNFHSRALSGKYLHNNTGILNEGGVFVASPERAVADMLYFNPRYHFDAHAHIEWDTVRALEEAIGYPVSRFVKLSTAS